MAVLAPSLAECFNAEHTDKVVNGYHVPYERLLAPRRWDHLRLLEIGVGTVTADVPSSMRYVYPSGHPYRPGGSLRAWRRYLPNATIVGIDVQPDCLAATEPPHIDVRLADSTDRAQLDAALGDATFDVIIDDGLHTAAANVRTLRNLWHRLAPGGLYVIEDVHPPLYHHWRDTFADLDAEPDALDNGKWAMLIFQKRASV